MTPLSPFLGVTPCCDPCGFLCCFAVSNFEQLAFRPNGQILGVVKRQLRGVGSGDLSWVRQNVAREQKLERRAAQATNGIAGDEGIGTKEMRLIEIDSMPHTNGLKATTSKRIMKEH